MAMLGRGSVVVLEFVGRLVGASSVDLVSKF